MFIIVFISFVRGSNWAGALEDEETTFIFFIHYFMGKQRYKGHVQPWARHAAANGVNLNTFEGTEEEYDNICQQEDQEWEQFEATLPAIRRARERRQRQQQQQSPNPTVSLGNLLDAWDAALEDDVTALIGGMEDIHMVRF